MEKGTKNKPECGSTRRTTTDFLQTHSTANDGKETHVSSPKMFITDEDATLITASDYQIYQRICDVEPPVAVNQQRRASQEPTFSAREGHVEENCQSKYTYNPLPTIHEKEIKQELTDDYLPHSVEPGTGYSRQNSITTDYETSENPVPESTIAENKRNQQPVIENVSKPLCINPFAAEPPITTNLQITAVQKATCKALKSHTNTYNQGQYVYNPHTIQEMKIKQELKDDYNSPSAEPFIVNSRKNNSTLDYKIEGNIGQPPAIANTDVPLNLNVAASSWGLPNSKNFPPDENSFGKMTRTLKILNHIRQKAQNVENVYKKAMEECTSTKKLNYSDHLLPDQLFLELRSLLSIMNCVEQHIFYICGFLNVRSDVSEETLNVNDIKNMKAGNFETKEISSKNIHNNLDSEDQKAATVLEKKVSEFSKLNLANIDKLVTVNGLKEIMKNIHNNSSQNLPSPCNSAESQPSTDLLVYNNPSPDVILSPSKLSVIPGTVPLPNVSPIETLNVNNKNEYMETGNFETTETSLKNVNNDLESGAQKTALVLEKEANESSEWNWATNIAEKFTVDTLKDMIKNATMSVTQNLDPLCADAESYPLTGSVVSNNNSSYELLPKSIESSVIPGTVVPLPNVPSMDLLPNDLHVNAEKENITCENRAMGTKDHQPLEYDSSPKHSANVNSKKRLNEKDPAVVAKKRSRNIHEETKKKGISSAAGYITIENPSLDGEPSPKRSKNINSKKIDTKNLEPISRKNSLHKINTAKKEKEKFLPEPVANFKEAIGKTDDPLLKPSSSSKINNALLLHPAPKYSNILRKRKLSSSGNEENKSNSKIGANEIKNNMPNKKDGGQQHNKDNNNKNNKFNINNFVKKGMGQPSISKNPKQKRKAKKPKKPIRANAIYSKFKAELKIQ